MPEIKLNIEGGRDLVRQLRKVDAGLVGELKSVHLAAAQVVLVDARRRAPVRSGKLRGSLRAQAGQRYGRIALGDGRRGKNGVPYAGPIHWGWPSRPNRAKRWRGGPIRANRFVWDAAQANEGKVAAIYRVGVDKLIRRADLNP